MSVPLSNLAGTVLTIVRHHESAVTTGPISQVKAGGHGTPSAGFPRPLLSDHGDRRRAIWAIHGKSLDGGGKGGDSKA